MKTEREIFKELVKECGFPVTVRDFETWQDVKAYGTYELGSADNQIWSWCGNLFRLCFAELSQDVKDEVLFAYNK